MPADVRTISLPGACGCIGDPARGNTMAKHFGGLFGRRKKAKPTSPTGRKMGTHLLIGQRKELVTSSTGWEDSL